VIDPRPYRIALSSAQAQLERARSSARFAQMQERRVQPLIEDQAISRQEYDQRTTSLTQGNADVRAAEAAVATPASISISRKCARRSLGASVVRC
jgi:membrane fusion protein, multidrug efflux system